MDIPNESTKRKMHDSDENLAVNSLEDVQIENEYEQLDSDRENEKMDNDNSDDEIIIRHKNKANYDDPDDDSDSDDSDHERNYDQKTEDEDSNEEVGFSTGQSILENALKSQKKSTLAQYDGIKVTPFNIKEELEEGQFDSEGNYTFLNKSKRLDNWEKTIDWDNLEKNSNEPKPGPSRISKEKNEDQSSLPLTKIECYKHMLRIMKHEETVQKCIRRLGDSIPKRRPHKNKSSSQNQPMDIDPKVNIDEVKWKLNRMIELAHQRLEDGDVDIYLRSYEELEDAIN